MPIQAWVDDSGGKGQGRAFVLAGFIGKAEDWATFSDEWKSCLDQIPSIAYFKMYEATKLHGQFENWKPFERDEKIKSLARIVNNIHFRGIHCTFDMDAFQKYWEPNVVKPMDSHYFFPFHIIYMSVCQDLIDRGHSERFEMFFDEQVMFGHKAKAWYPLIKDLMEPRDKAIMPIEPEFRDDREFLPLQAADMLAWLWRRAAEYGPNSFDWVARELNVVEMSPQSAVFSAKRMKDIVEHSFELRFTEEEIDEYKRRYNLPTNDAKRNWKTPKMPPKGRRGQR